MVNKTLDRLRQVISRELGLIDPEKLTCWGDRFPMFEWNADEKRLEALHHVHCPPFDDL